MFGRRRRRYPSREAFVASPHQQTRDGWHGRPSSSPSQDEGQTPTKSAGLASLTSPRGPRGIRPTVTGPAWIGKLRASFVIAFL
jgi:hypothetical protein